MRTYSFGRCRAEFIGLSSIEPSETSVWEGRLGPGRYSSRMQIFRLIRGAITAVGIAAGVASALRLRGSGGVPPRSGGWRELSGNELE